MWSRICRTRGPVFARRNAPVQTDMVTSVFFVDLRIHSSTAAAWCTLGRDDDDLRCRSVFKRVIGDDLHPAACLDRVGRLGHGIKTERRILAAGNHDILEDFPWSAEVDDYRAFRNEKCNGDTALGWSQKRIRFARGHACRRNRSWRRLELNSRKVHQQPKAQSQRSR